jgi:alpha-beta hydrolase superfamily lysophospholipase
VQVTPTLKAALHDNPGYTLKVVGHSMGAGTAAMATMMMRE